MKKKTFFITGGTGSFSKAFIKSITQEAITTLTGKDITKNERARLFRAFMNKHFSILSNKYICNK